MKHLLKITLFALLCSCYPKSRLLNWHWRTGPDADGTLASSVRVHAFAFPADAPAPKDFWSMTEDAQQAYIEQCGARVSKPEELASAIANPMTRKSGTTNLDLSTFKKKIVLSIMHDSRLPADRIASMRIKLVLDKNSAFSFVNWDKIVTQYSIVDLGTSSLTNTGTFKLAPEINMAGDILGVAAGEASRVTALTEEAKLAKRFVEVNGSLSNGQAWLDLNGMPGRDLAGNVVLEVSLKANRTVSYTVHQFGNLFSSSGAASKAEDVVIGDQRMKVPYTQDTVRATVMMDACVRHVIRGGRTIAEGDDKVQFSCVKDTQQTRLVVLGEQEFDTKLYFIYLGTTNKHLRIMNPAEGGPVALCFSSREAALELVKWLKNSGASSIGGNKLLWQDYVNPLVDYKAPEAQTLFIYEERVKPENTGVNKFFELR